MRQILGSRRAVVNGQLEEWVDWMVRTTRECEAMMREHRIPDCVEEVHRRKFRWAGNVARRRDGRWTREVLTWSPAGLRARKRPLMRWTDSLQKFAATLYGLDADGSNEGWMALAEDEATWRNLEDDYVNCTLGR